MNLFKGNKMSELKSVRDEKNVTAGTNFIHPLMCTPVLQNIFGTLDLEELKICRLVCGHWNPISLLHMRNNPKVIISLIDENRLKEFSNTQIENSNFQRFKFTFSLESEPNLSKFINQFENQLKGVTFVVGKDEDVYSELVDKLLSFLAENSSAWETFGLEIKEECTAGGPLTPFDPKYEVNWSQFKSLSISTKGRESPIFTEINVCENVCVLSKYRKSFKIGEIDVKR